MENTKEVLLKWTKRLMDYLFTVICVVNFLLFVWMSSGTGAITPLRAVIGGVISLLIFLFLIVYFVYRCKVLIQRFKVERDYRTMLFGLMGVMITTLLLGGMTYFVSDRLLTAFWALW